MDFTIDVGDGFIFISETELCRYEITFQNELHRPTLDELTYETLNITLYRGNGSNPDDVFIFDNSTNLVYQMTVEDNQSGTLCVPWPLLG